MSDAVPVSTDFFLHIPRSGGSSLRTLLSLNYPGAKSYAFSGAPREYSWFLSLSDEDRASYRLLHGHFPFGLHAGLEHFRYFTLIREPLTRHFSEFFYAKKYSDHHSHERIKRGDLTLEWWSEIGEHHAFYHNNALCQFLSGDFQITKPTYATFQAACSNLEKMQAFGLTDRFQESALMISKYMDWKKPVYGVRNMVMGKTDIPETLRLRARSFLEWDLALYDFARQLFEKRLQEESRVMFPALESYRLKVAAVSGEPDSMSQRYEVDDEVDPKVVEANRLDPDSPITTYLDSPHNKPSHRFVRLPLKPVVEVMKVLEAAEYFINPQVFNRTWIRVWWFGLIDVRYFPRAYHQVFGWFTCEPRDDKGRLRLRFDDPRVGFVATSQWMFPVMEDVETGQAKRFFRFKGPRVRFEIREDNRWKLVQDPFQKIPAAEDPGSAPGSAPGRHLGTGK